MELQTLRSFSGIPFGASPATLGQISGAPLRRRINKQREEEFEFEDRLFCFDAEGLVEVTFKTPEILVIDGLQVRDAALLAFMRERDPEYFEHVGFAFSPRLGLRYDLDHEGSWTAAVRKGRFDRFLKKA